METYTYLGGLEVGTAGDAVGVEITGEGLRIVHRPSLVDTVRRRAQRWEALRRWSEIESVTVDSGENLAARQALLWGLPGLAGPWKPDESYLVLTLLQADKRDRLILHADEPALHALQQRIAAARDASRMSPGAHHDPDTAPSP